MDHKEVFTDIYNHNRWGGSGGGSMPEVTGEYRAYIDFFIKEKNIKHVIYYGCGDWAFSKLIDWSHVSYTGVDCVQSVVDKNNQQFARENIKFVCSSVLPVQENCELLILKDILQHWTNQQVADFLFITSKIYKYILITNTSNQSQDNPIDTDPHVHTRALSASFLPLKEFNPVIVLETNINEPKQTSLITNLNL